MSRCATSLFGSIAPDEAPNTSTLFPPMTSVPNTGSDDLTTQAEIMVRRAAAAALTAQAHSCWRALREDPNALWPKVYAVALVRHEHALRLTFDPNAVPLEPPKP